MNGGIAMLRDGRIQIGTGVNGPVFLLPSMANRHGLIAGATGTGKTVTLKVLAESFSDLGVPVFLSDIKSDLSGMVRAGDRRTGDRSPASEPAGRAERGGSGAGRQGAAAGAAGFRKDGDRRFPAASDRCPSAPGRP